MDEPKLTERPNKINDHQTFFMNHCTVCTTVCVFCSELHTGVNTHQQGASPSREPIKAAMHVAVTTGSVSNR